MNGISSRSTSQRLYAVFVHSGRKPERTFGLDVSYKAQKPGYNVLSSFSALRMMGQSIDQTWQTATSLYLYEQLYRISSSGSQEQQFATTTLNELLHRPDLSNDQIRQIAESLYHSSLSGSQEQQFAIYKLLSLTRQLNLSSNWNKLYTILRKEVSQFNKIDPAFVFF